MTQARIYQPAKNAMQSGKGKNRRWLLEYVPEAPYFSDDLMGWNGMSDTVREISIYFPSKEAAVLFAKKHGIDFEVITPNQSTERRKSYADNFAFNRIS